MHLFLVPPANSSDPGDPNFQATTFVIGQLCARVLSCPIVAHLPGYTNIVLYPIWPVLSPNASWPGIWRIDDAAVASLAEAIAKRGVHV